MKVTKCDRCNKIIKDLNIGRKNVVFQHESWRIIIKGGVSCDAYMNKDLCFDCLIDILKKCKDEAEIITEKGNR